MDWRSRARRKHRITAPFVRPHFHIGLLFFSGRAPNLNPVHLYTDARDDPSFRPLFFQVILRQLLFTTVSRAAARKYRTLALKTFPGSRGATARFSWTFRKALERFQESPRSKGSQAATGRGDPLAAGNNQVIFCSFARIFRGVTVPGNTETGRQARCEPAGEIASQEPQS